MDLQGRISRWNFKISSDSILSLYAFKTGKPQVEFRYEISDRNFAVKFHYGI